MRKPRNRATVTVLALMLAIGGLLVGSPANSQEPNRQLVQNASPNTNIGKRLALVIGNGAYTSAPPLRNPPNDARDMAATLRALGFDVTSGINANQRDMKRLIREFGQKLRAGGSGLFYYAGHGVQSKGRNYLVPVDADIQSEAEVEDSGVDVSLVLNYMDDAQNGLNIVILDACRNNPFSRSFRSASSGLAQVDAPTGTLIAYATAPGRVASDGTGQNGLYTSELLKQMRVPGLSATEMFMRVRAEVMKQTGNKQVPWEASSLVGSFYFSGSKNDGSPANLPANEVKVDPLAFELSYWETIKNSTDAEDFGAYLEKYPNGQFASLARNNLRRLAASASVARGQSIAGNWAGVFSEVGARLRLVLKVMVGNDGELKASLDSPDQNSSNLRVDTITFKDDTLHFEMKEIQGVFDGKLTRDGSEVSGTWRQAEKTYPLVFSRPAPANDSATELAFWDSVKNSTSAGDYRAYLQKYPNGTFVELAKNRLAPLEAAEKERAKGNETARTNSSATDASPIDPNAKVFGGYYGIVSSGFAGRAGKLVVSSAGIQIVWNSGKEVIGDVQVKYIAENPPPFPLPCSSFAKARTEGDFIREISQDGHALIKITGWGGYVARFKAASATDAAAALAAVREVCKNPSSGKVP